MASLARTILEEHLERGELVPGQEIALRVDQTLAQDATGTMACMEFEALGLERVRVELVFSSRRPGTFVLVQNVPVWVPFAIAALSRICGSCATLFGVST